MATPATTPSATSGRVSSAGTATATPRRGAAQVPGVVTSAGIVTAARVTRTPAAGIAGVTRTARYRAELPHAVTTALFASAKAPLARGEHLYRDVAACTGIGWELLAAVDWMQCKADPRYSPVHGEKLGSLNADGTAYPTKSAALDPVRLRPRRARRRGLRHRPDRAAAAVGARARRRVRRVPLGRHPAAARRLPDGIPLLRRPASPLSTRRCTGRPSTRPTRPTGRAPGSARRSVPFPSSSASATRLPSYDRKRR